MLRKFINFKDQAYVVDLGETLVMPSQLPERASFIVATYNLHNLFGKGETVNPKKPPASKEQLDALAEMLIEMDADAIGLQEVGDLATLKELLQKVNRKRARGAFPYTRVLIPSHDPRGINVAVATRLSVRGAHTSQDREFGDESRPEKFSRDLLEVQIAATPTYSFTLFVAHLKSKLAMSETQSKRAEQKRGMEATEIRNILGDDEFGTPHIKRPMLLVGDMNDYPDAAALAKLRGEGPPVLRDILAEGDHAANYTYPTHNRYRKTRLDYVFASPSISIERYKIHRDNPAAKIASDHYPVSVTVKVRRRRKTRSQA
jgi:endonuclease/exonuclease/phosphatase family metal-dependent hydrolase